MSAPKRMNMREARTVTLVEVKTAEGSGVEGDPVRIVTTYWFPDGGCAAVFDPLREAGYEPPAVVSPVQRGEQ